MLWPIRWITWAIMRLFLATRYRVKVVGKPEVFEKSGPYLILPNHPAYADPPNLLVHLWPAFQMRPLLLETNFKNPVLAPFGWLLRSIDMPDISRASAEDRRQAEAAVGEVDRRPEARRERDPLAERPALPRRLRTPRRRAHRRGHPGRGAECHRRPRSHPRAVGQHVQLGGRQARPRCSASSRRSGCGSPTCSSSRRGGESRSRSKRFTQDQRPEPTREAINQWLEEWYNADVPRETPTFVPHHFLFGPRTHEFPPPAPPTEFDLSKVKPETKTAVAQIIEEKIKRPLTDSENRGETTFSQLGMDSLDAHGGHARRRAAVRLHQRHGADDARRTLGARGRASGEGAAEAAARRVVRPAARRQPALHPRRHGRGGVPEPGPRAAARC